MKSTTYYISLTEAERSTIIQSLVKMKNKYIAQGKYTDAIDETLYKILKARLKKFKILSVK